MVGDQTKGITALASHLKNERTLEPTEIGAWLWQPLQVRIAGKMRKPTEEKTH